MPKIVNANYSLWDETYLRKCRKIEEAPSDKDKEEKPSSMFLCKDFNFHILWFVYGTQMMRIVSHMTWLGTRVIFVSPYFSD